MQIVELPIEGISQISNGITVTKSFLYSNVYDEENYQDLICSLKKEGESSIIDPKRFRYEYDLYPRKDANIINIENPNDNVMMIEFLIIKPINTEISYNEMRNNSPTCNISVGKSSCDIIMGEYKQILIQIPSKISIINLNRSDSIIRVRSSSKLNF